MSKKRKNNILKGATKEFEHLTDDIIPFLVIGIAAVLIMENPFWTLVELDHYEPWVSIFDSIVVFFFVSDLIFKWFRTRQLLKFLKLYWIDIIAVFPFYLAFRAYAEVAGIFRIGEEVTEVTQKAMHEAVLLREAKLVEKEARLARELKAGGRIARSVGRFFRTIKGRLMLTYNYFIVTHKKHKREHKR